MILPVTVNAIQKSNVSVEISVEEVIKALEQYVKHRLPSLKDIDYIDQKTNEKMIATSYDYHKGKFIYTSNGEASEQELQVTKAIQTIKTLLLSSEK